VTVTSPGAGSVFDRKTLVTATANVTDNVRVAQVRFYYNGNLRCTTNAAPYQCAVRLPNARNSSGTIQVQANDAAGNLGASSTNIWIR
jgi:hypothetical protein